MRHIDDIIGDISHLIPVELLEELNAAIDEEVQDVGACEYNRGYSDGESNAYEDGFYDGQASLSDE